MDHRISGLLVRSAGGINSLVIGKQVLKEKHSKTAPQVCLSPLWLLLNIFISYSSGGREVPDQDTC